MPNLQRCHMKSRGYNHVDCCTTTRVPSRSGKKIYISKRCTTYATWTRTAKTIARFHLILMPWWCFQVVGILLAWSAPFVTSCEVVRKLGSFRLKAPAAVLVHLGAMSLKLPNFLTTSQDVTKGADQAKCTKSYIVHLLEISMNWNHWPFVHFISWYPWIKIW